MVDAMGRPVVTVALACPGCGEMLRAPRGDLLLACHGCGTTSEVRVGGMHPVPHDYLSPSVVQDALPQDPDLWLPYWCFKVTVAYSGDDVDAVQALESAVSPGRVYVPAFRQRSSLVFGDMGLLMTWKPVEAEGGAQGTFTGATMGSVDASRLVEPMVLWRADQIQDITGIEVAIDIRGVKVVGVPAADRGSGVEDLTRGKLWPAAAFLDLEALRFALERERSCRT